jgi:serine/threonine protein kinase
MAAITPLPGKLAGDTPLPARMVGDTPLPGELAGQTPLPDRPALSRDQADALESALKRLPEDCRQVILLRHRYQRSFTQIGETLNRPVEAARHLWARAIESLQHGGAASGADSLDESFAQLLAAYDESLATGQAADSAAEHTLPRELWPRFRDARAALELLEAAWPRSLAVTQCTPREGLALELPPAPVGDTPSQIGGYTVLRELGRGGMGVVYLAQQGELKRLVALKMILSGKFASPQQLSRFRAEAEAVARLQHPNIVQIYEIGEAEGRPYFSLEFMNSGSLAQKLAGTPQPPRQSAELVETLAWAVHHAHQRGIVHRDLKPANILLCAESSAAARSTQSSALSTLIPKITDFGLAKQLDDDSRRTHTGVVIGTPSYMAPEQAAGTRQDVGPPADIYALGAILYEMLTGRPPFQGPSFLETLEQVRSGVVVPPSRLRPGIPRNLEIVCLKSLEREPGRRYASARALAEDLGRWTRGEPVLARLRPWPARILASLHRHRALAGCIALALPLGILPPIRAYVNDEGRVSRAQLGLLQQEIAKGGPIELLGEKGPPRWYQFRAGQTKLRSNGPFELETYSPVLLDLLPSAPWEKFRLRAEVRLPNNDWAEAGLYYAHNDQATAQGMEHRLFTLCFGETDKLHKVHHQTLRLREESDSQTDKHGSFEGNVLPPLPVVGVGVESVWHELAIEVTPEKVRVLWEGNPFDEESATDLTAKATFLFRKDLAPESPPLWFSPRGSLGLYVHRGAAEFRRVVVEPLP